MVEIPFESGYKELSIGQLSLSSLSIVYNF